ncbi:MAG: UDP-N-acetylmuramate:L-alanyl-gamma-D-glutamyl-meso-diaminopimelate ligase [Gammaproteobacteria bacterium]
MHIHILGICGTFMGGIARIAHDLGHKVTGSDQNVYPPMSDQLQQLGINLQQGYLAEHLQPAPDLVIVGNTISRGNPALEYVLNQKLSYCSGPEWLYSEVLRHKHVLAVAGTHGKTTTTSMLAWLLEHAGLNPGFLIGGVAENFGLSARVTSSDFFVIEADEYDTAFSDKRSKFIHYRPNTLIINNIEFDHADIFHDLAAIRREFHNMVRILPETAEIIYPAGDAEVERVLDMGCWSQRVDFAGQDSRWQLGKASPDYRHFEVKLDRTVAAEVNWTLLGEHNAMNALAAIIAARHIGIEPQQSAQALAAFRSVKRRLECILDNGNIRLFDDFAHHPTAIRVTLKALRAAAGENRIIAIMEPRSNTMRMGVHKDTLADSLREADVVLIFQADNVNWDISQHVAELGDKCRVFTDIDAIVGQVKSECRAGDYIVVMSNGGFGGIHKKLLQVLADQ